MTSMASGSSEDDSTKTHAALTSGMMVSRYRIIERIGVGGMGEVYLAEDTTLKRQVALKFLPAYLVSDDRAKLRFAREAQAAAKLNHPNIVHIYEVSEFRGRPYFAMEHCEGQSLRDWLKSEEPALERILRMALQICEGLREAHAEGVVHRDVKPSNIILDKNGQPKLADFGLAAVQGAEKLTKTGSTVGTVGYMSPEQIRVKEIDQRSDLFSFGVVLYEMIAGRAPFRGDTEAATLSSVLHDIPEPLSRYKSGVSGELERIVSKLLEKDVEMRYQSAREVRADIRRLVLAGGAAGIKRPRRIIPWIAAAIALILTSAVVYLFVNRLPVRQVDKGEPQRKTVAVLPFENLGSPDDGYFADALTDEITSRLARISGLLVISRTSSMKYRNTEKTLREIGAELGVDYILEGTILWDKSGDTARVRITPQLIRVSDDSHVWADNVERPLTQLFVVQADIASHIAAALDVTLLRSERDALDERSTDSPDAYQAYLAAKRHGYSSLAIQMYERAVELDPDFARAYAALSEIHSGLFHYAIDHTEERLRLAKEAVDRALGLQADLPEAHLALGYYYYRGYREYDEALVEFAIAERDLPNNPSILEAVAVIWRRMGRFEDAASHLERASRLDPLDDNVLRVLAVTLTWLRDYRGALEYIDRAIALRPDKVIYYCDKAMMYMLQGDLQEARSALATAPAEGPWVYRVYLEILDRDYDAALDQLSSARGERFLASSSFWTVDEWLGLLYGYMGEPELSRAAFDSSRAFLESHFEEFEQYSGFHASLGIAYAGLGRREDAIREGMLAMDRFPISKDALDGATRMRELAQIYLMVGEQDAALDLIKQLMEMPCDLLSGAILRLSPFWDPLREHPRFQALLREYGGDDGT
jgi:serine/threonine protein kinase/tetratricopeptide (TPR) repeat protein